MSASIPRPQNLMLVVRALAGGVAAIAGVVAYLR